MDNNTEKVREEVQDLVIYLEKAYYQLDEMRDEYIKDEFLSDLIMSAGSLGDCIHRLNKILNMIG